MKVKVFLNILFLSVGMIGFAQTTSKIIFEENFEEYEDFAISGIGSWLTLDLDQLRTIHLTENWKNSGRPQAFIIFNPSVAKLKQDPARYYPKSGKKYAACWMPDGGKNNDWLISPPITLGASVNELSFFVKSPYAAYPSSYEVGLYVGSGVPSGADDFTIISGNMLLKTSFNWEQERFNLDSYAGQTVRIGIHCVSDNQHVCFMVDDFKVTGVEKMGSPDFFKENFSVFPNPAHDLLHITVKNNLEIKAIRILDFNGKTVKTVSQHYEAATQINIADLAAGTYFISIETNKGIAASRFFKN